MTKLEATRDRQSPENHSFLDKSDRRLLSELAPRMKVFLMAAVNAAIFVVSLAPRVSCVCLCSVLVNLVCRIGKPLQDRNWWKVPRPGL